MQFSTASGGQVYSAGCKENATTGSGTFFLEPWVAAWPNFQLALGERLDLQPKPFVAPGFLLVAGEARRVRVVAGQAFVE